MSTPASVAFDGEGMMGLVRAHAEAMATALAVIFRPPPGCHGVLLRGDGAREGAEGKAREDLKKGAWRFHCLSGEGETVVSPRHDPAPSLRASAAAQGLPAAPTRRATAEPARHPDADGPGLLASANTSMARPRRGRGEPATSKG